MIELHTILLFGGKILSCLLCAVFYLLLALEFTMFVKRNNFGSYNGVIKREAVYKCTNKDYLPEAKPRANDHFTCEAEPSNRKVHCPRA